MGVFQFIFIEFTGFFDAVKAKLMMFVYYCLQNWVGRGGEGNAYEPCRNEWQLSKEMWLCEAFYGWDLETDQTKERVREEVNFREASDLKHKNINYDNNFDWLLP